MLRSEPPSLFVILSLILLQALIAVDEPTISDGPADSHQANDFPGNQFSHSVPHHPITKHFRSESLGTPAPAHGQPEGRREDLH
ncbi:hypothetical protein DFH94DRAFT_120207 [Russula ochroleuca]|uniref:Uncharacterized protein n=1 Tax=Russula ochroleuca TaxID=152965 RepID=A0A9P5MRI5_9AGAM|nr:hypothetical protein DFH94DRAFT_120207 [Russula ochroleuca]